jgi:hypothetical protein
MEVFNGLLMETWGECPIFGVTRQECKTLRV